MPRANAGRIDLRVRSLAASVMFWSVATACSAEDGTANPTYSSPAVNYALNCQGCHLASGAGMAKKVPNMRGQVAKFLHVDGGRDYLIRVPGMANAAITDAALANLANWVLATFDPENIPDGFRPFTEAEVAVLRKRILVTNAGATRTALLQKLKTKQTELITN